MHCERCNTDFPEGLRYCKWCGGPLVDRPRITSELHACPKCAAAIQPGWTFCKACGERLHASRESAVVNCQNCGAPTDPNAKTCSRCGNGMDGPPTSQGNQESTNTVKIVSCSACGERLDTGSLYCKACGTAAYTDGPPASTFPPVSPVSTAEGARSDEGASSSSLLQKAPTLPDLDEQMAARKGIRQEINSGANTWALKVEEPETPPSSSPRPKVGADTSMLPGTAGARSEQQTPTANIDMGRTTGPVDDEPNEVRQPSEIHQLPSEPILLAPSNAGVQPPLNVEPARSDEKQLTTGDFGSEKGNSSELTGTETAVFVSPIHSPSGQSSTPSQDDIRTLQFQAEQLPASMHETRELLPDRDRDYDPLKTTVQKAYVPEVTASTLESSATRDLSRPEVIPLAGEQVLSQPQPNVPERPIELDPSRPQPDAGAWPVEQETPQAAPARRTGMVIASIAVALIIVGGAIYAGWWFLFARVRPQPPVVVVEPPSQPAPPTTPDKPAAPIVPEGMVAVAAGSYTIGRDNADPLEKPMHKVTLPAFFIDRTEVTNAAYKKFMDATGHKAPTNWTGRKPPEGRDNSPVTGVTWQDAADYAAWAGKRLPTELEWEAAARGTDGRIYPWGNDYRKGAANIGSNRDDITAEQYPSGLKDVGGYSSGASPSGALDLIGNAWEWAADEFALYPGGIDSIPADIKERMKPGLTYRVIRGGAYDGNKEHDATYRGLLDGSQAYPKVGFRCAKNAK